ncbi:hypothetical protein Taro_023659, partial [Colocasia esculenta]|nr:hypothetical protein [Colocasia esculenta]
FPTEPVTCEAHPYSFQVRESRRLLALRLVQSHTVVELGLHYQQCNLSFCSPRGFGSFVGGGVGSASVYSLPNAKRPSSGDKASSLSSSDRAGRAVCSVTPFVGELACDLLLLFFFIKGVKYKEIHPHFNFEDGLGLFTLEDYDFAKAHLGLLSQRGGFPRVEAHVPTLLLLPPSALSPFSTVPLQPPPESQVEGVAPTSTHALMGAAPRPHDLGRPVPGCPRSPGHPQSPHPSNPGAHAPAPSRPHPHASAPPRVHASSHPRPPTRPRPLQAAPPRQRREPPVSAQAASRPALSPTRAPAFTPIQHWRLHHVALWPLRSSPATALSASPSFRSPIFGAAHRRSEGSASGFHQLGADTLSPHRPSAAVLDVCHFSHNCSSHQAAPYCVG